MELQVDGPPRLELVCKGCSTGQQFKQLIASTYATYSEHTYLVRTEREPSLEDLET